jgi:hypothetical protein
MGHKKRLCGTKSLFFQWKGLPILIQCPVKKEFDDKKRKPPKGWLHKIKLV